MVSVHLPIDLELNQRNQRLMKLTIQLFAGARETVGSHQVEIEIPDGATVGDLRLELARKFPELDPLLPHCQFAVNQAYAKNSDVLTSSSEVACIPPVSGG